MLSHMLIKLYFFQIVKELKNSDLEKIKPKSIQVFLVTYV